MAGNQKSSYIKYSITSFTGYIQVVSGNHSSESLTEIKTASMKFTIALYSAGIRSGAMMALGKLYLKVPLLNYLFQIN